jgi:hypothetical protein
MWWFKYLVMLVFAVEAVSNFLASRGKQIKQPTPTGMIIAGVFYVAMVVMAFIFIS